MICADIIFTCRYALQIYKHRFILAILTCTVTAHSSTASCFAKAADSFNILQKAESSTAETSIVELKQHSRKQHSRKQHSRKQLSRKQYSRKKAAQ
jgi:hypothetical protein